MRPKLSQLGRYHPRFYNQDVWLESLMTLNHYRTVAHFVCPKCTPHPTGHIGAFAISDLSVTPLKVHVHDLGYCCEHYLYDFATKITSHRYVSANITSYLRKMSSRCANQRAHKRPPDGGNYGTPALSPTSVVLATDQNYCFLHNRNMSDFRTDEIRHSGSAETGMSLISPR